MLRFEKPLGGRVGLREVRRSGGASVHRLGRRRILRGPLTGRDGRERREELRRCRGLNRWPQRGPLGGPGGLRRTARAQAVLSARGDILVRREWYSVRTRQGLHPRACASHSGRRGRWPLVLDEHPRDAPRRAIRQVLFARPLGPLRSVHILVHLLLLHPQLGVAHDERTLLQTRTRGAVGLSAGGGGRVLPAQALFALALGTHGRALDLQIKGVLGREEWVRDILLRDLATALGEATLKGAALREAVAQA